MSESQSVEGSRSNVGTTALVSLALEWEPTSDSTAGRRSSGVGGSAYSLLGTFREWALADSSRGVPVSRSTNTWSSSQSCQWKFTVNWSNAEYIQYWTASIPGLPASSTTL